MNKETLAKSIIEKFKIISQNNPKAKTLAIWHNDMPDFPMEFIESPTVEFMPDLLLGVNLITETLILGHCVNHNLKTKITDNGKGGTSQSIKHVFYKKTKIVNQYNLSNIDFMSFDSLEKLKTILDKEIYILFTHKRYNEMFNFLSEDNTDWLIEQLKDDATNMYSYGQ
jgi:hypothetical protein